MAEVSDEDLERLASRMAMLVSEPGEADNAGRAVAALARRLGLSGGQLKAFFLAGASQSQAPRSSRSRSRAEDDRNVDRLERELSALRHGLKLTEVQARNAIRERDALRAENGVLVDALDRAGSAAQVRKFLGGAAIAASILGGAVIYAGPALRGGDQVRERPAGSPFLRAAVIRGRGAAVLQAPEQGAALVTQLTPGTRVEVRQMVWRALMQWAEIEVGGISGYVLTTEIELS